MIKAIITADSKYPVDRKRIRAVVETFLVEQGIEEDFEVGVTIVGDRKMKELNNKYLGSDKTTDVLSFSQMEEADEDENMPFKPDMNYLGDVVVSWPQAVTQAMERNITVDEEIDFLVKHGLLHLLGIHHD